MIARQASETLRRHIPTWSAHRDQGALPAAKARRLQAPGIVPHTVQEDVPGVRGLPAVRQSEAHTLLRAAKARLDPLALYQRPVKIERVRIWSVGWLFLLPWFRRFDAYAVWNLILLRSPELGADAELLCHELCHVWQMQHHPVRMPLSYLRLGYADNPYEQEARRAAASQQSAS